MYILGEDRHLYTLVDREFYEPLERHRARTSDFVELARRVLPADWRIEPRAIWCHCTPPGASLPAQGWKIHLSATYADAAAVLTTAARVLAAARVPFKCSVDKAILLLQNGKRWSRGGAGKFMTAYPRDETQCGELLERLHQATVGYHGPYILSDRRYRDSQVVYYRYGGFQSIRTPTVRGESRLMISAADGTAVPDQREAYFHLPPGIADPFAGPGDDEEPGELKDGRYRIESVIIFSNTGGVYTGRDTTTGDKVLIKEARPFTGGSPSGTDAVSLLKKEHRLLTALEDARVAPRPIDFFRDWEHYFLVEEYLEGTLLRGENARISLALRTRPTAAHAVEYVERYCRLYARVAEVFGLLHARGIVFGDVSHYNVMVLDGGEEVRLIDFEAAREEGVDLPTLLHTPGFAPEQMLRDGGARAEDDCFGLGGLMLAGLMPINNLRAQDPGAHHRFLDSFERDLTVPGAVTRCVRELMDADRARRPRPAEVAARLRAVEPATAGEPRPGDHEAGAEDLATLPGRLLEYAASVATFDRADRLFPADPTVFDTNPLGVAYGACGVAYALHEVTGSVDPRVREWILRHEISAAALPPGLYVGMAGIAWTLLELGMRDRAEEVARESHTHPLLWDSPDLYYGAAGWGMAQLRFFMETGDERYLGAAKEAGCLLLRTAREDEGRLAWASGGAEHCGLAHGAAGVSLFLLYLHLATGDERWLDAGRKGLAYVLARSVPTVDGGLSWRAQEGQPTYTPYWRWGSAGIGMVLLRYQQALGEPCYQETLDGLFLDVDRKYSVFPGRLQGLAGMADFLLDLEQRCPARREQARAAARRVVSGMLLFQVQREAGPVYPGESLARLSCDFGTGSAGVALVLDRLVRGTRTPFMLDPLLDAPAAAPHPGRPPSGARESTTVRGGRDPDP